MIRKWTKLIRLNAKPATSRNIPLATASSPPQTQTSQNTYNGIFNQLLRRLLEDAKMLWPLGVAEAYGAEPVIPVRRDSGLLCVV